MWLLALATYPLLAQQVPNAGQLPPTREQVMKFFEVMHLHDQMQTLLQTEQKQINVMAGDMFSKQLPNATPEQRAQLSKLINTAIGDLFTNYPLDDVLRDMVPVYQNHLTESDLEQVVAFYASPVGQKMIKEMPAMTAEAMRVSYTRLQPQIEEMMKKMDAQIQAMAAEGKKADPASGTKTSGATPEAASPKN